MKILLVEDNPYDVELTLTALREINLANEVVVARDGQEALDYLYQEEEFAGRPDGNPLVVFLDLKMPGVDGFEVLRRVKGDMELKIIPIVVLTSSREEKDIGESYNLGVNAYIVKPLDFEKCVQVLKELGRFWVMTNEPPPGSVR